MQDKPTKKVGKAYDLIFFPSNSLHSYSKDMQYVSRKVSLAQETTPYYLEGVSV